MNDPDFDAPVNTSDELVTVATYDNAVAARMALNHLCEAGLAAVLSDESTVAMDWLLSNAIGGIKVQVHSKDVAMAHRLLEEHHPGDAAPEAEPLADETEEASVSGKAPWDDDREEGTRAEAEIEDDDDIEEEPPLSDRERNGLRAFRGALLGILFPPIEFYVLYLVYKVFVSEERLGARYRFMACAAAVIMLIVLGGMYAIFRPR
jgi:Putative prokaryotic signal transducing protein